MTDFSNADQRNAVSDRVLAFYRELPFNYRDSAEAASENVRSHDPVRTYPPLRGLVKRSEVLEIGSGVGWCSNGLAYHHHSRAHGIDLNPVAVQRATEVAKLLRISSQFQVADVFAFEPTHRYPLVVSLGVLHHTADCHGAIQRICERFLTPNGKFLLGLYHSHGRTPFLDHFRGLQAAGVTEDDLLREYGRLHQLSGDVTHLRSWFRDQVLHPHETQHTYAEIRQLLETQGMTVTATSLNRFQPIVSHQEIERLEVECSVVSRQAINEGRYYPGFFVVMAEKAKT